MRKLGIITVILFSITDVKAERFDQFIDWDDLSTAEIAALKRKIEDQGVIGEYQTLREAKYLILNGNKEMAKLILSRVLPSEKGLVLAKKRLLALIEFLDSDYEASLNILDESDFQNDSTFEKVCMLKLTNMIFLGKRKRLYSEYTRCSNKTIRFSLGEHIWLEGMLSLHVKDGIRQNVLNFTEPRFFRGLTSNLEKAILWLKMVIYLNQEKQAYDLLSKLPTKYFQSQRFKEALAFIYYRLGNFKLAEKLVSDLEGANSENIRGNIRLKEEKYELAYGHYRLALQKKNNSTNALERLLPLTWILGEWDKGIEYLNYFPDGKSKGRNKKIIKTVFLMRKGDIKGATEIIKELFPLDAVGQPLKVNQLISYLAVLDGNEEKARKASLRACRQYDALNCWLLFQFQRWKSYSTVVKSKKKVKDLFSLKVEDLKKEVPVQSIIEPIYINQEDIEELDENLIQVNIDK